MTLLADVAAHAALSLLVFILVACILAAFVYWVLLEIGLPQMVAALGALLVFLIVLLFVL